ncbi:hypothetical protein V6N13_076587 [Hibiscus sabdariffa]
MASAAEVPLPILLSMFRTLCFTHPASCKGVIPIEDLASIVAFVLRSWVKSKVVSSGRLVIVVPYVVMSCSIFPSSSLRIPGSTSHGSFQALSLFRLHFAFETVVHKWSGAMRVAFGSRIGSCFPHHRSRV